ncbi:MAG: DUF2079 domain-containing protein [Candidatus Bathyarchaeota archaeon]|nr:MAG: DUF2079 domain-containing protein [Candidatus Bathyarchaeota archaeon]
MTKSDLPAFVIWVKKKIKSIEKINAEKIETFLSSRKHGQNTSEFVIYLMILVYTILFSYFTILKHQAFSSFAWDFGISHQALSTTLNNGRLFYYTPEQFFNPSGCYFGLHFSPILFLLLPVYALYQMPETLFVFQSFIIALGALPLYLYAKNRFNSKLVAVSFSLLYLLYPPLQGANWFDFHVQSFLPLFFFSAMYCLETEKWIKYFAFIILALMVAENVSLIVFFIGLYGILKYRSNLFGMLKQRKFPDKKILVMLTTMSLAIIWLLIARWIQNTFFPINPAFSSYYRATDYWSVLGIKGDPISMPLYIILNPLRMLQALVYDAYLKFLFLILTFGSLLFLPITSSMLLITLPFLGPALLSNNDKFYVVGIHYPLYYIPFLFLAAIAGMHQIHNLTYSKIIGKIKNMLVIMSIFSLFASPLSPLLLTSTTSIPHFSEYSIPNIGNHEITLQETIALVPQNASVLTQNNIFPHFSGRINAYVVPLPQVFEYSPLEADEYMNQLIIESDYVLMDMLYDQYTGFLLLEKMGEYYKDFALIKYEDGIYLYRRRTS